jgi:hypothetical protein
MSHGHTQTTADIFSADLAEKIHSSLRDIKDYGKKKRIIKILFTDEEI